MKIQDWLQNAVAVLSKADIPSARLDAELIVGHALDISRAQLLTSADQPLSSQHESTANKMLARRANHEPLAYIRGFVEFFGHEFRVTPNVLIPRPETESLVEYAIKNITQEARVLDCGTGSGAIAISLKLQRPDVSVIATDISPDALRIAGDNAEQLTCDVKLIESDLLTEVDGGFDWVIANLPYVTRSQSVSPETAFEPSIALYSAQKGLEHYQRLFKQLEERSTCRNIILEAEPDQEGDLRQLAVDWELVYHSQFCYHFRRR